MRRNTCDAPLGLLLPEGRPHNPAMSPQPRKILLGVTGGIAAYKSPDLVRRLHGARRRSAGRDVARRAQFVTPLTFQAVSGRPVRTDLWDAAAEAAMGHIELARWADEIVVAPATADFIARLAHGLADDLLATLCLATDRAHRARAGDESPDVGERRHAGERAAPEGARRAHARTRRAAIRPAAKSAPAACSSRTQIADEIFTTRGARRSAARPEGASSPRGRRAKRSIRCASSAIAAPARWASQSRRRRAKPARKSCS